MALICHISEARQDIQDMPESQTHVQYFFPLGIPRPKTEECLVLEKDKGSSHPLSANLNPIEILEQQQV